MAGLRFVMDLFIPEVEDGTEIAGVIIPSALASKIPNIRDAVRQLKAYAVVVNKDEPDEEFTVQAQYHKCHHNEDPPRPCEPWQEI